MGLILNPIAFRVGHFKSWTDAWHVHRTYYPVFLHNVLYIKQYIYRFFLRLHPKIRWRKWLLSHSTLCIYNNKININMYVYCIKGPQHRNTFKYFRKNFRWKQFLKLKLGSFWQKKQLVDRNKIGLGWFLIFQYLNVHLDKLKLVDHKPVWSTSTIKFILKLRKKYTNSSREWVPWEQIEPMQNMLKTLNLCYDKLGVTFLWNYFKTKFKATFKFTKFDKKSIFCESEIKKVRRQKRFKYNYIFLFFIMSITHIIIERQQNHDLRLKKYLSFRDITNIMEIYFFWFIYKPIFKLYGTYIESKVSFIANCSTNIKFFLLDNRSVSAEFIARYIVNGLRIRRRFRDIKIPVLIMLKRLMYSKTKKKDKNAINQAILNSHIEGSNKLKNWISYTSNYIFNFIYILIWIKLMDFKGNYNTYFYFTGFKFKRIKKMTKNIFFLKKVFLPILYKKYNLKYIKMFNFYVKIKLLYNKKLNLGKEFNILKYNKSKRLLLFYKNNNNKYYFLLLFLFSLKSFYFIFRKNEYKFLYKFILAFFNFQLEVNIFFFFCIIKQLNILNFLFNKYIIILLIIQFNKLSIFNQNSIFFLNFSFLNFLFLSIFKEKFVFFYLFFYISEIFIRIYHEFKIYKHFVYKLKTFKKIFKKKLIFKYFIDKERYYKKQKNLKYYKYSQKRMKKNRISFNIYSTNSYKNRIKFYHENKKFNKIKFIWNYFNYKNKLINPNKFYFKFFKKYTNKVYFISFLKEWAKIIKNNKFIFSNKEKFLWLLKFTNLRNFSKKIVQYQKIFKKDNIVNLDLLGSYYELHNNLNNKKIVNFIKNYKVKNYKIKNYKVNKFAKFYKKLKKKKDKKKLWSEDVRHPMNYFFRDSVLKISKLLPKARFFFLFKNFPFLNYFYFLSMRFFLKNNIHLHYKFHFKIDEFLEYIAKSLDFNRYYKAEEENLIIKHEDKTIKASPILKNKNKKRELLLKRRPLFWGYKFGLKGKFSRKQRATNLWFKKGAVPLSAMNQNIDYSLKELKLKYGKCSVRIWLYKSNKAPNYYMRFF